MATPEWRPRHAYVSPPSPTPPRSASAAHFPTVLAASSRKLRRDLRNRRRMLIALHREHRARSRFGMAHPTALWRLTWRVVLFAALVARIVADLRATYVEAGCA